MYRTGVIKPISAMAFTRKISINEPVQFMQSIRIPIIMLAIQVVNINNPILVVISSFFE